MPIESKDRRRTADSGTSSAKTGWISRVAAALRAAPVKAWQLAPPMGLALLSAGLLALAYRPIGWSPVAFVALVPWLWALRGRTPLQVFAISWVFGAACAVPYTWFLHIISQFNALVLLGLPLLWLYLGFYTAVAGSVIVYLGRRVGPWWGLLLGACVWAGIEWWKQTGAYGLPYGFLGHTQSGWLLMAQLASLGGVPMVSALIVATNLALMDVIASHRAGWGMGGALARTGVVAVCFAAALGWGTYRLSAVETSVADERGLLVRVAVAQTNIEQTLKFASYATEDRQERQRLQHELALRTLGQIDQVERGEADLIVTPESSFTTDFFDRDAALQREIWQRARDLRASIFVGSLDSILISPTGAETENLADSIDTATGQPADIDFFNAVWLFRPDETGKKPRADYHKVHLMPMGEHVPYLDVFPWFTEGFIGIGSMRAGESTVPLAVPLNRGLDAGAPAAFQVGPTICFEDLMPWVNRAFARRGAQLLVNMTNDAWYDPTSGSAWHADKARWRSIETGLPMVRATNTGVSGVIDGAGRTGETLPLRETAVRVFDIRIPRTPSQTPHTRFGDWFGALAFLAVVGTTGGFWWRERQAGKLAAKLKTETSGSRPAAKS